ncbi:unnamed protein product [Amoebophrya sp. A25]|nr:unnamed protein product [Amoebophrya sp. A25]|eukprot:GSA25T00007100001.1
MLRSITGGSKKQGSVSSMGSQPLVGPGSSLKARGSSQYDQAGNTSGASTTNSAQAGGSSEDPSSGSTSDNEFRAKRSRGRLTEEEYEFIARDIMAKPPMTGYLKYHLPLRYAARTEEVRWIWVDQHTGQLVQQDLIGGGRNSDLEYD